MGSRIRFLSLMPIAWCQLVTQAQAEPCRLELLWEESVQVSRDRLVWLHDSLSVATDPDAALGRQLVDLLVAHSGHDLDHLAAIERRLGEVAVAHPNCPWGWFLLAVARTELASGGRVSKPGPLQPIGMSYLEGALAATYQALSQDSVMVPAAQLLGTLLHLRAAGVDSARMRSSLARTIGLLPLPPPSLLLTLFELEFAAGEFSASEMTYQRIIQQVAVNDTVRLLLVPLTLVHARRSLRHGLLDETDTLLRRFAALGGDSAVLCFEEARLAFARSDAGLGNALYYHGAGLVRDSASRALYVDDAALTASLEELRSIDTVQSEHLAQWLRFFWESRDVADGQPVGARLAEHRRRVLQSLRVYSRPPEVIVQRWHWNAVPRDDAPEDDQPPPWVRAEPTGEIVVEELNHLTTIPRAAADAVFDDRGLIYIRHGEPDRKANHSGVGRLYNESWLYRRPGSPLVLHFHTPTLNPSDFRLVDRPVGGLMTACQVDAAYCVLAGNRSIGRETVEQRERMRQVEQARIDRARGSDAFPPVFEKDIPGVVRSYALPAGSGETLLLTAIAIPQEAIHGPSARSGSRRFGLRVSAAFRDGSIFQRDTSLEQSAFHRLDADYAATLVAFRSPRGRADLTVMLLDSVNKGGLKARDSNFQVRDLEGTIAISDIILGRQRAGLRFPYDTISVPVDPRNLFVANDTLTVFYVVTGLARDELVRTELEIGGDGQSLVNIAFQERVNGGAEPGLRSIELKDLKAGHYIIRVKVTELVTNRVASQSQEFTVVGR